MQAIDYSTKNRSDGFTLIQLVVTLLIIGILAGLTVPGYLKVREKAEEVKCMSNLKNLHEAMHPYIRDFGHWPQENMEQGVDERFEWWAKQLEAYDITKEHWMCPTYLRESYDEDAASGTEHKICYIPTQFAPNKNAPYQFLAQPWFIEVTGHEGKGSHIILPSGDIRSTNDLISAER